MAMTREEVRSALKQQAAETFCKEAVIQIQSVRDYLSDRQVKGEDFNPSLCSLDHALWCLKTVEAMLAKTSDAEQTSSNAVNISWDCCFCGHHHDWSWDVYDCIDGPISMECDSCGEKTLGELVTMKNGTRRFLQDEMYDA